MPIGAIIAASCQAFLLLGNDQGPTSGIIGAEYAFAAQFNNPSTGMQGDIIGLYDNGCVVGSIICHFVDERCGRRTMLIAGGLILIVDACTSSPITSVAGCQRDDVRRQD